MAGGIGADHRPREHVAPGGHHERGEGHREGLVPAPRPEGRHQRLGGVPSPHREHRPERHPEARRDEERDDRRGVDGGEGEEHARAALAAAEREGEAREPEPEQDVPPARGVAERREGPARGERDVLVVGELHVGRHQPRLPPHQPAGRHGVLGHPREGASGVVAGDLARQQRAPLRSLRRGDRIVVALPPPLPGPRHDGGHPVALRVVADPEVDPGLGGDQRGVACEGVVERDREDRQEGPRRQGQPRARAARPQDGPEEQGRHEEEHVRPREGRRPEEDARDQRRPRTILAAPRDARLEGDEEERDEQGGDEQLGVERDEHR